MLGEEEICQYLIMCSNDCGNGIGMRFGEYVRGKHTGGRRGYGQ